MEAILQLTLLGTLISIAVLVLSLNQKRNQVLMLLESQAKLREERDTAQLALRKLSKQADDTPSKIKKVRPPGWG